MDTPKKAFQVSSEEYALLQALKAEKEKALLDVFSVSLYQGHPTIKVHFPGTTPYRIGVKKIMRIISNAETFLKVCAKVQSMTVTTVPSPILTVEDMHGIKLTY